MAYEIRSDSTGRKYFFPFKVEDFCWQLEHRAMWVQKKDSPRYLSKEELEKEKEWIITYFYPNG